MTRETRRKAGQRGAGLVEYGVLGMLISLVAAGSLAFVGHQTGNQVSKVSNGLSGATTTTTSATTTATPAPTANPSQPVSGGWINWSNSATSSGQMPSSAYSTIYVWGHSLTSSGSGTVTGTFTIKGMVTGSVDYTGSWTYNLATGGDQVIATISFSTLEANVRASGDYPLFPMAWSVWIGLDGTSIMNQLPAGN